MLLPEDWVYNRDNVIKLFASSGMLLEEDPNVSAVIVVSTILRMMSGHCKIELVRYLTRDVLDTIIMMRARAAFISPLPPEASPGHAVASRPARRVRRRGRSSVDLKNRFGGM